MPKPSDPMDSRSKRGIFSKGQNVYEGASSRPNPEGTNQYGAPSVFTPVNPNKTQFQTDAMGNVKKLSGQELQDAAKMRLRKKGPR